MKQSPKQTQKPKKALKTRKASIKNVYTSELKRHEVLSHLTPKPTGVGAVLTDLAPKQLDVVLDPARLVPAVPAFENNAISIPDARWPTPKESALLKTKKKPAAPSIVAVPKVTRAPNSYAEAVGDNALANVVHVVSSLSSANTTAGERLEGVERPTDAVRRYVDPTLTDEFPSLRETARLISPAAHGRPTQARDEPPTVKRVQPQYGTSTSTKTHIDPFPPLSSSSLAHLPTTFPTIIDPLPPPPSFSLPPLTPKRKPIPLDQIPPNRTSCTDPIAVSATINGISTTAVISSALGVDCISPRLAMRAELQVEADDTGDDAVVHPLGHLGLIGAVEADVGVDGVGGRERRRFMVAEMESDCVLGTPYLQTHEVTLDAKPSLVSLDGHVVRSLDQKEIQAITAPDVEEQDPALGELDAELDDMPTPALTTSSLPSTYSSPSIIASALPPPPTTPGPSPFALLGTINGARALISIDTSSPLDILSPHFASHAGLIPHALPTPHIPSLPLSSVIDQKAITHGVRAPIRIAGNPTWDYFDILPLRSFDAVLGMPYLRRHSCRLDLSRRLLTQGGRTVQGLGKEELEAWTGVCEERGVAFPDERERGGRKDVDMWGLRDLRMERGRDGGEDGVPKLEPVVPATASPLLSLDEELRREVLQDDFSDSGYGSGDDY